MISEEAIEAYNSRLTVDTSNISKLTPSQKDTLKSYGDMAETLCTNRDLAMFIHHFKFEITDQIIGINAHTPEANAERVALSNELRGIDNFVNSLKMAVYRKNRLLKDQA
jgi:hypothetical protein|tara:strand:+ start:729 stop:1058 length:330 start_codon:yes stop_codon:yes gene_type:complete